MAKRQWTEDDVARLKALAQSGASAVRASAALKRSLAVTKRKAYEVGTPFLTERAARQRIRAILDN